MSNSGLSQRLAKFKADFTRVLGPKRHGYNEVGLEQPLVGSHTLSDDDYYQQHGVSRPGGQGRPATQGQYQGPQDHSFADSAGAAQPYAGRNSAAIPDEVPLNCLWCSQGCPLPKASTSHPHLGLSQPSCHKVGLVLMLIAKPKCIGCVSRLHISAAEVAWCSWKAGDSRKVAKVAYGALKCLCPCCVYLFRDFDLQGQLSEPCSAACAERLAAATGR